MAKKLDSKKNGKNGATTTTIRESYVESGKTRWKQVGKLEVKKGFLRWWNGYETGNNRYCVDWKEFIDFMSNHPE